MKKTVIMSCLLFISFLFISQGLSAQRYYRNSPGIEGDYNSLNLTQEQIEEIDKLEIEFEKEFLPLFAKLRSNYMELEELEAQRSPDLTKMEKIMDIIYEIEREIQNKEILHEKKIRDLLTGDQKALLDSYSTYGANFNGRGGYGRGNFGRGYGGYGAGIGQNYTGRGAGRLDPGYYGYGNVVTRGLGRNVGYLGRGTGQLGYGTNPYLRGVRYGRGPCGAGLARLNRMGYGRGRWIR
jgi:Spy/CpxP family protein refolding chaperone